VPKLISLMRAPGVQRIKSDRRGTSHLMPTTSAAGNSTDIAAQPTRIPGVLLGLGLGGFVDGIVVHQLFQWHHLISATHDHPVTTVAGLEANTFADGLFHMGTWILVLAGTMSMLLAWRRGRLAPSWRSQIGLLLAGWGSFNLVEGMVNHQILGIHHVRDDLGGPLSWDLGFVSFALLLLVGGWALHRSALPPARP
jgi:uncharacterized membrane protein